MQRVDVGGITLEYEEQGAGEPVVFIHGGALEGFLPLTQEPALKDRFRMIRYHKRGYWGSKGDSVVPISRHAADCVGLLRALGAEPAHVVGHSSGGTIALQLALDSPDSVRSLTLLEPAGLDVPSGAQLFESFGPAIEKYQAGDKAGAMDAFTQAVFGKGYPAVLADVLPGAMEQAAADADSFLGGEFPAVGAWTFTREGAARIKQPVSVLGGESHTHWPAIVETHQLVLDWIPQAKPFVLPGANHMLHIQNPHDMAEGLAAFLASN